MYLDEKHFYSFFNYYSLPFLPLLSVQSPQLLFAQLPYCLCSADTINLDLGQDQSQKTHCWKEPLKIT